MENCHQIRQIQTCCLARPWETGLTACAARQACISLLFEFVLAAVTREGCACQEYATCKHARAHRSCAGCSTFQRAIYVGWWCPTDLGLARGGGGHRLDRVRGLAGRYQSWRLQLSLGPTGDGGFCRSAPEPIPSRGFRIPPPYWAGTPAKWARWARWASRAHGCMSGTRNRSKHPANGRPEAPPGRTCACNQSALAGRNRGPLVRPFFLS